jgi:D-alanine-D-alanine ligase
LFEYSVEGGACIVATKKNEYPAREKRTLGPVSDLERHLPTEWWRTLFNSIYLKTDGDVVENEINTRYEVDTVISTAGLEKNDRILDLCCGQGRHLLELARRGYTKLSGIDRSRYLIRLARQRAKRENLNINFREGDARQFQPAEDPYNAIMIMGNSFGYFEQPEDDLAVLEACRRALAPGGTLVLDITDGDWMRANFDPRSWEWIDQSHMVCRERTLSRDGTRLISREVVTHAERGVIIDQFYAERLYSKKSLLDLLKRAGFEALRVHGELQPDSERKQDLGMMGRRLMVTALTPRVKKTPRKKSVPFSKITVLLGDPRLPDEVKRDGHFNPEDYDTLQRLKRALQEIDDFEFSYMDNHAAYISELRTNPPDFVLNFCDEGYNNDAFMELHVPAFLEMLDIPYSGAGPSCLGLCYNKSLVNAYASSIDIPVPMETFFTPTDQSATIPATFPALVKPNFGDSSIGITKNAVVHNPEELIGYIRELNSLLPGRPILVQEYLTGPEYSVGIIGNPGLSSRILPVLEVDYSGLPEGLPHILGYESKWLPDSPYWDLIRYREAELPEETVRNLQDYSMLLFERLGCRDYARFDYRCDSEGNAKLLEVNPNPGWCWDGKFNLMAGFAGLRYPEMLRHILDAAFERILHGRPDMH